MLSSSQSLLRFCLKTVSFSISAGMHGTLVSNFLLIMLSQVNMLLWEFFITLKRVEIALVFEVFVSELRRMCV